MQGMKKKKLLKIIIPVAVAVFFAAVLIYLMTGNHAAADEAKLALAPTDTVSVSETDRAVTFTPAENKAKNGLIFYPGAKVDAEAYAPFARGVAENGVMCAIVKMPFDLAIFNSGGAKEVIGEHPEIEHWYISGHSLGGVMAADYAAQDARIEGIAFLASYPSTDLSHREIRALSITAENDGVLNRAKYEEALQNLPADAILYEIKGGNHAGFGSYGTQDSDGDATIPPKEQQGIAAAHVAGWMNEAG